MTQGKVGGRKKILGGFGYATTDQVLVYSQVNTPLFNPMGSSGNPVQLLHFSKEVSSLTGASSFVVFACVHHGQLVPCECIARNEQAPRA